MVNQNQLLELVKRAREGATTRNFNQSAELTVTLKDIDIKKGFSLNEVVAIPHNPNKKPSVCVVAIMDPAELDRLGTNRREARKIVRAHDFFLADTAQMATIGRSLGQFLGPKGKMPTPLPYGAPVDSIAARFKKSVRVRSKNQLNVSAKIGDEKMDDKQLAENASAIIAVIEKKLPQGDKNIRNAMVKFTMGKASKLSALNTKENKQ